MEDKSRGSESTLRLDARAIFGAALDAVEPASLVEKALAAVELPAQGEILVAGFGKAAAAMARGLDRVIGDRVARGVLVVPRPALRSFSGGGSFGGGAGTYRVLHAGHPTPDEGSVAGARAVRDLARSAGAGDLLIALISGGGSALLALPPPGVRLEDIAAVTDGLSRAGVPIGTLNAVRKHLDLLKGGRLAREAVPARTTALILSDVPGDAVDVVASGPLTADPTTFAEALAAVERLRALGEAVPASVLDYLARGARGEIDDSPPAGDACFDRVKSIVIGSGATAAAAACQAAGRLGYRVEAGPTAVGGDVRDTARSLTSWIRDHAGKGSACFVTAGETTVRLRGRGTGGRNQQLALEAAPAIDGLPSVLVGALATDGVDGSTAAAGAWVTGTTVARARSAGFDIQARLADNDAHPVLGALNDLILTGATGTNVADIHVALVG